MQTEQQLLAQLLLTTQFLGRLIESFAPYARTQGQWQSLQVLEITALTATLQAEDFCKSFERGGSHEA